jgi:hypothetical protein
MAGPRPRDPRNRRAVWIGGAAVLALIGLVTAAVVYLTRGGYDDIAFQPFTDIGKPIAAGEEQPQYVYTQLVGDRAYLAYQRKDDRLEVIAVEAKTAKELWRKQTTGTSDRWAGITALPNGLVVHGYETSDATPRKLIFFDLAGNERGSYDVRGEDGIFFLDKLMVIADRTKHQLVGLSLPDFTRKWDLDNPKDSNGGADAAVYPVTTAEDLGGPADPFGWPRSPNRGDDQRLVLIGADRSAWVIDATKGNVLKSGQNVADPDDRVVAHEGTLYVAPAEGGYRLDAYDLDHMGVPASLYTAADRQHRAHALEPCGKERVCLLETTNSDSGSTELVVVDSRKKTSWRAPAAKMDVIVPVGEHIMVRSTYSPYKSTIYGPDRSQLVSLDGVGARLDGGNVLMFAEDLSSSEDSPSVAGVRVSSDQPVQLGPLKQVRPASCSWDIAIIVCAAKSEFVLRRFAKP